MKSPDQIMAQMYKSALFIMIVLLVAAGAASFLDTKIAGMAIPELAIRFYLLIIPAMLLAFTITMFVRKATNLAVAGLILSSLWLAFKWLG